jgi:hypothetical protein
LLSRSHRQILPAAGQNLPIEGAHSDHALKGCAVPSTRLSQDYRLMVDAIQSGDLAAARNAYGGMMERLSSIGVGADGALTKIGASLRRGDLAAANRTLEVLESRALRVLHGLRELADLGAANAAPGSPLRRPH